MEPNLCGCSTSYEDLRQPWRLHFDIRTIISGHRSPIYGPELVDHYLQLLALKQEHSPGS